MDPCYCFATSFLPPASRIQRRSYSQLCTGCSPLPEQPTQDNLGLAAQGKWLCLGQSFPAGKAGLQIVPKLNIFLVLFPAQENLASGHEGGKIDEPALKIFELNFARLEPHEHFA